MSRSILRHVVWAAVLIAPAPPLGAADLQVPTRAAHAYNRVRADCGPCGCLRVALVRHRELQSTYGLSFDPRNYDTTEPHFYFGRMRAYPRCFVDG